MEIVEQPVEADILNVSATRSLQEIILVRFRRDDKRIINAWRSKPIFVISPWNAHESRIFDAVNFLAGKSVMRMLQVERTVRRPP